MLLDACDGGVAREKYEVIKEGWFDSERASNGVRDERVVGGGSGGGRMRRGVYGSMSTVATRKSLRWGIGSGMRIASRWQFGGLEEYMSLRRG